MALGVPGALEPLAPKQRHHRDAVCLRGAQVKCVQDIRMQDTGVRPCMGLSRSGRSFFRSSQPSSWSDAFSTVSLQDPQIQVPRTGDESVKSQVPGPRNWQLGWKGPQGDAGMDRTGSGSLAAELPAQSQFFWIEGFQK